MTFKAERITLVKHDAIERKIMAAANKAKKAKANAKKQIIIATIADCAGLKVYLTTKNIIRYTLERPLPKHLLGNSGSRGGIHIGLFNTSSDAEQLTTGLKAMSYSDVRATANRVYDEKVAELSGHIVVTNAKANAAYHQTFLSLSKVMDMRIEHEDTYNLGKGSNRFKAARKRTLIASIGGKSITSLTLDDAHAFIKHAERDGLSPTTIRTYLTDVISSINHSSVKLTEIYGKEFVDWVNPFTSLKSNKKSRAGKYSTVAVKSERRDTMASVQDLKKVLATIDEIVSASHLYDDTYDTKATVLADFVTFMIYYGIRPEEISNIKRKDINLDRRTIKLKDAKAGSFFERSIGDSSYTMIKRRLDNSYGEYLFTSSTMVSKPFSSIYKSLRAFAKRADVPYENIRGSDWRRHWKTTCQSFGINAAIVDRMQNHAIAPNNNLGAAQGYRQIGQDEMKDIQQRAEATINMMAEQGISAIEANNRVQEAKLNDPKRMQGMLKELLKTMSQDEIDALVNN